MKPPTFRPAFRYFGARLLPLLLWLFGSLGLSAQDTCLNQTPWKNDNPLNGVSTYDLVLISRHILGLELLDSPYKIIGADANNNDEVTSFDIVELRKLILGIYNELPNNTSWRFVDAAYVFPNPGNPFQQSFPETKTLTVTGGASAAADFVGIKVGDVNNNAVTAARPGEPDADGVLGLDWSASYATAGRGAPDVGIVTVSVRYTGDAPLPALQGALRFDPARLEWIGVLEGETPHYTPSGCFGLTGLKEGLVRTAWIADMSQGEEGYAQPGAVLFNLVFRRLGNGDGEAEAALWLDAAALPCLAWDAGGRQYTLRREAGSAARYEKGWVDAPTALWARCRPNPGASAVSFEVHAPRAGKGRIALFDPQGRRVYVRDVALTEGEQHFPAPETAALPLGLYVWKVYAAGEKTQGIWVKNP